VVVESWLRKSAVGMAVGVVAAVCCSGASAQIGARKPTVEQSAKDIVDPRVANILAEAELESVVTANGNYLVPFGLDAGRSQNVYVRSQTSQWGDMEIREVYSYAYASKTRLSQAKLEKLLKANADLKSGAWELIEARDWVVIMSVKVAAECDGDALRTVAKGVALTTDEVEREFTGKDEH